MRVFVVGAGASCEFGLPSGFDLKDKIRNQFSFTLNVFGKFENGSRELFYVLDRFCKERGHSNADLDEAREEIRKNILLAPSIDNFLDTRKHDPLIVSFGKMAIVQSILRAESTSSLSNNEQGKLQDIERAQETWLFSLFNMLVSQCDLDKFKARLSEIVFVSFNYDRCIKHFILNCHIPAGSMAVF
jgi:hypothetical protein